MEHCKPDLNSRQMLWGLCDQVHYVRDALFELSGLDDPLRSNENFYHAMVDLVHASKHIASLRQHASPILLSELENDVKVVTFNV